MRIGDIYFSIRGEDTQLKKDIAAAGTTSGKTFGERFKTAFSKSNLQKGFMQGLGLAGGLGAVSLVSSAVGAVADAFSSSIDAAAKFDDQLRTINTVAQVSDEQLQRIGDSIQALSRETGKTTEELTSGFYDLVSAGVPAEHAMDVLKDSAILATGALGTTQETVDLLTSTLNAYGMEATESGRLTDIFAKTVADGKVTAGELGQTIAQIAPIASAAGVEIEEVAAGFAELTAQGTKASMAATQMKSAISALITPNETLARIQDEVNLNFAEMARSEGLAQALQALRDAAGSDEAFAKALGSVDALQFALAATGENAGDFAQELAAVEKAARDGGVALGQYTEKSKSAAEAQKRLDAEVMTLQQDLGAALMPIQEAFVEGAKHVVNVVRELGEAWADIQDFISDPTGEMHLQAQALEQLAEQMGLNVDQVQALGQAELDAAAARKELTDTIATSYEGHKDATQLTNRLTTEIMKMATASGRAATDYIEPLLVAMETFGIRSEDTAESINMQNNALRFLAGYWTDVSGEMDGVITDTERAEIVLRAFFRAIADAEGQPQALNAEIGQLERGIVDLGDAAVASGEDVKDGMGQSARAVRRATTDMFRSVSDVLGPWREEWKRIVAAAKDPFNEEALGRFLKKRIEFARRQMLDESLPRETRRHWAMVAAAMKEPVMAALLAMGYGLEQAIRDITGVRNLANAIPGFFTPEQFYHRASGGRTAEETPYWVGETGPELFFPDRPGYVMDSASSAAMAGMSGSLSIDVNVHDVDGGIARAGMSAGDWASQLGSVLNEALRTSPRRYSTAGR